MPDITQLTRNSLILTHHADFASPSTAKHYAPNLMLEPINQTINLTFDIPNSRAFGWVETVIRAKTENSQPIQFNAVDLQINSVKGPEEWHYSGTQLEMRWHNPFQAEETRICRIEYEVKHPKTGLYFSFPDKNYPDRAEYAATDNESERARYWLPCIDHPSVRCSVDFFLTGKTNYTIIANGRLIDEIIDKDGKKTAHWQQRFPCPSYLLTLAVGNLVSYTDRSVDAGKGEIPLVYYTHAPYTPEMLRQAFSKTGNFLTWLSKKLGPLEWDKYYQIITSCHRGAMENISLVSWGDFAAMDAIAAKEMQYHIDSVNAHEMSHSWFGDMIVIREFSHTWVKEGWATYMGGTAYFEYNLGISDYQYQLYQDTHDYINEVETRYVRPIVSNQYHRSWDMYDAHTYPGGAMRVHMLRMMIGDKVFWPAVRDYLAIFKGKVVETVDFQRILEKHSGRSLEAFFEQWFFNPGYPKFKASFGFDKDAKLGSVTIEQTQIDEKKHIGLFKMPLEILWESPSGTSHIQTYEITEKIQTLYFSCEEKPVQVLLDPNHKLLFSLDFNPGDDLLLYQLQHGDVIARICAAQELAKTGSRGNLEHIKTAYLQEKYWGVKIEIASALKKVPSDMVIDMLVTFIESETEPMALQSIIKCCEDFRDGRIFKVMQQVLARPEPLYYANAAALGVIGMQRSMNALTYLKNYKINRDPKHIIRQGLFRGMGNLRIAEATEWLLEHLPLGKEPESARPAIINAIINSLIWAEYSFKSRVLERITDSLNYETTEHMLTEYARASSQLPDLQVIPILETIRTRLSSQQDSMINRMIEKVKSQTSTETQTKHYEQEVEDLKQNVRKLTAKIAEFEGKLSSTK